MGICTKAKSEEMAKARCFYSFLEKEQQIGEEMIAQRKSSWAVNFLGESLGHIRGMVCKAGKR